MALEFRQGGFEAESGGFDTVLFNGSLQFFANHEKTLQRALEMVGPGGKVVVAHANGAAFVRDERRGSPLVVMSDMPTLAEAKLIAANLGASLVGPVELGIGDEAELEGFYLISFHLN
jgi:2-polyprenyl-3-methyl-5-hydroxy-6-metoxy-1,4-benzoquinol methylase